MKITTAKDYRGGSIDETETEAGANEREETPFLPPPFFPLFFSLSSLDPSFRLRSRCNSFFSLLTEEERKKKREEEKFNNGIFEE